MDTIGRLAGGVAHDFNNLLTTITGYSELLLRRLPANQELRRHAEQIERAAYRAARLTRQLLAFSRKQILQPRVLDLNAVVTDIDSMLRRLIGEHINLVTTCAPGLWRVKADLGQIEQVILNLAINARDAMPTGGELRIETQNVTIDEATAPLGDGLQPNAYVCLRLTDTGTGMTDNVKAHLFEPFFTTKPLGKGTGLGLATCYGIIKQSGGHITVTSAPGAGATFAIYLPHVDEPVPGEHHNTDASKVLPGGTETILLVEDEPAVLELAATVLVQLGYTVLRAGNGAEALRLVREHNGHEVDLVLTDVVMPQMGGKDLADTLRTERPAMKVLFASGYTEDAIVHHGVIDPGVDFIEKPYTPGALARKVREVLDA
jgi:CheY-like chemotaxis protein